jgi:hypothetical protein
MKLIAAALMALLVFGATWYLFTWLESQSLSLSPKVILPFLRELKPGDAISFLLNSLLFIIALLSLYVAVLAFQDAQKSGQEQKASLEKSREALESVVATATRQQELLDKALHVSSAHFELVQKQSEEEARRLARKPLLEFAIGEISEVELTKLPLINLTADKFDVVAIDFRVKNVGDAAALKPVLIVSSQPASVKLSERGQRPVASNPLQFAGLTSLDIQPFSIAGTSYRYPIDAWAPNDRPLFVITFSIYAENAPQKQLTINVQVTRPPQSTP